MELGPLFRFPEVCLEKPIAVNALEAASDLGVSHKTVLRWATVGGSEIISGARRVGKEWAIPLSEIERIKARRQLTYARIRDTRDWANLVQRMYAEKGADALGALSFAVEEFTATGDPQSLIEAAEEYKAWDAMRVLLQDAQELERKAFRSCSVPGGV